MRRKTNNSVSQYALVACLGVALLLGQMFKLHMHVLHDESPTSATAGHIVNTHVAASLHDTMHDTHHQDDVQDHHHAAEIDISSSGFVKKAELLNPLIILFFITSIILYVPQLRRIWKEHTLEPERPPNYYLLHPPLRAPPA